MTQKYEGEERRKVVSLNGVPEWVKIVNIVGFPVFMVLVGIGIFVGYVPSPLTETRDMLKTHVAGEIERTRIIRVMCRHQSLAYKQNADDCDWGGR